MEIRDGEGKPLDKIFLFLTDGEAKHLHDGLEALLESRGERGWHWHTLDERFWIDQAHADRFEREVELLRADNDEALRNLDEAARG